MFKQIGCCCVLMAGFVAQATAAQGCPYPSSIRYVQGYFEASEKNAHWRSSKVENRDFIDVFLGALFTADNEDDPKRGYLEKCIYRAAGGQVVALRYSTPGTVESMLQADTVHWRDVSDALGLRASICQDSQPDNCAFTVKHSK